VVRAALTASDQRLISAACAPRRGRLAGHRRLERVVPDLDAAVRETSRDRRVAASGKFGSDWSMPVSQANRATSA